MEVIKYRFITFYGLFEISLIINCKNSLTKTKHFHFPFLFTNYSDIFTTDF